MPLGPGTFVAGIASRITSRKPGGGASSWSGFAVGVGAARRAADGVCAGRPAARLSVAAEGVRQMALSWSSKVTGTCAQINQ